jgi:hypothetical protein
VTDSARRMTVVTPDGEFPIGDPRASQAIAAYVRSQMDPDLTRHQIDQINAALVLHPQDGVCINCQKRLPMFLFDCAHWEVYGFSHNHALWLCTHCRSRAAELADDGKCICAEFATDAGEWDPFTAPTPGTPEFRRAHAAKAVAL